LKSGINFQNLADSPFTQSFTPTAIHDQKLPQNRMAKPAEA